MTIAAGICNSFKQELLAMTPHQAADVFKLALFPDTASLSKATTTYNAAGEVTGQGYTAGGIVLTAFTVSLDGDTAVLDFADPNWPNATITGRGGLIYNSSRANKAVAVIDFGENVTSTNGTFTVTFPSPTAAAGLIRFG